MQENGKVNACESNYGCWGSRKCNLFLNTSKNCYDGGDCFHQNSKISKCNDINCCNGAEFSKKSTNIFFQIHVVSFVLYHF